MEYKLPKTVTTKFYFNIPQHSNEVYVSVSDMSDVGWACLGSTEITLDVPQADPRQKMIEGLEAQATKLKADHQVALNRINDKIQSLMALEHG